MGKVLHASDSGYFPTCIIDGEPPTPESNYLEQTLVQAMGLYWRVKIWESRCSGSYHGIENTFVYPGGSFVEMSQSFSAEEDLVCYDLFACSREQNIQIIPDGGEPYTSPGTIFFAIFYTLLKKSGSLYYPRFVFQASNIDASLSSSYNVPVGTYTIKFLGYTLTGIMYGQAGSDASSSVLLEMRAKEYWSYGGTYNTSTGQPL
jgi:hypothetical protein